VGPGDSIELKFALMLRYKLASSFASVIVEEIVGINTFREFNSVYGTQPASVKLSEIILKPSPTHGIMEYLRLILT
jgi:hypothetical protein